MATRESPPHRQQERTHGGPADTDCLDDPGTAQLDHRLPQAAGLGERIRLVEGDAQRLPFDDGSFDGLTFTYFLRYVEDPGATLAELARTVRPGGTIAGLEFAVPQGLWRPAWELYVRVGLPLAGRALSRGWAEVGDFLGPSIRGFYERYPVPRLHELWWDAGIRDVRSQRLSLGGGIVTWGRRA